MALLAVQRVSLDGLAPAFVAADAGGDTFTNSGRVVLRVQNGGVADIDVTINSQRPCNYGFDHDVTVTVPAGGEREIGPFPTQRFNDPSGQVHVAYSDVTSVTVAAVEVA